MHSDISELKFRTYIKIIPRIGCFVLAQLYSKQQKAYAKNFGTFEIISQSFRSFPQVIITLE